uniref:Secreted protein n=1 Tax=Globisporangium ultimum (strain ATCC 200006 / CBS 805.95 / DAOM BR144) TaxID=431595 RepID=K3XC13_GLOUD
MCDDLTSCLCGTLCCMCCVSAADSDNRSRHRREYHGRHAPVYVQPVVVTAVPMNGKAHHDHQRHANGYYYVQHTHHGKHHR